MTPNHVHRELLQILTVQPKGNIKKKITEKLGMHLKTKQVLALLKLAGRLIITKMDLSLS